MDSRGAGRRAGAAGGDLAQEDKNAALEKKVEDLTKIVQDLQTKLSDEEMTKMRQEAVKDVLAKLKADADQRGTTLPSWMDNLKFSGNLRLRYEHDHDDIGDAHNLGRFRLRFGVVKTFPDQDLEVGFRLASGSSDDPTSTNQTFTGSFDKKSIWIDRAYAKWMPKWIQGFSVVAGKMANPFYSTNMIWDTDLNLKGAYAEYNLALCDFVPFVGAGYFSVQDSGGLTGHDVDLMAYQAGFNWKVAKDVKWTEAVAFYDYDPIDTASFLKANPRGNTFSGGQFQAEEFKLLDLTSKVGWKLFNLPMSAVLRVRAQLPRRPERNPGRLDRRRPGRPERQEGRLGRVVQVGLHRAERHRGRVRRQRLRLRQSQGQPVRGGLQPDGLPAGVSGHVFHRAGGWAIGHDALHAAGGPGLEVLIFRGGRSADDGLPLVGRLATSRPADAVVRLSGPMAAWGPCLARAGSEPRANFVLCRI